MQPEVQFQSVDAYIAAQPAVNQVLLQSLRNTIRKAAPDKDSFAGNIEIGEFDNVHGSLLSKVRLFLMATGATSGRQPLACDWQNPIRCRTRRRD